MCIHIGKLCIVTYVLFFLVIKFKDIQVRFAKYPIFQTPVRNLIWSIYLFLEDPLA